MKIYKVGDLRRMVKESAKSEFEPKFGNNVQKTTRKTTKRLTRICKRQQPTTMVA